MNPTSSIPLYNTYTGIDYTENRVKKAIWLYFWLLIFEGALRKWFLPGLASPLLIVRDPVAVYILFSAWSRNRFPSNLYVIGMVAVSLIGILTAVLIGHGNLSVALYGARILLIHFPLTFVIGSYFSREDAIQLGKVVLWLTLPMAILITFQFYSPQSAWVNRGLGGDVAGAGFSGALDYFRPPATFSFITGTAQFFSLSACYIFFFWINSKTVNRLLLISATIGLLASIPLSISRTLFYQVIVSAAFASIAISRKPKFLGRFLVATITIVVGIVLLSQTNIFQIAIGAFTTRLETATEQEGGIESSLINRTLGGMLGAINDTSDLPFFGKGIGMGTNVGGQILAGDRSVFLISEGEWGRLIGEQGLLMGLAVILLRTLFVIKLALASYKNLRSGDLLPWLLLSIGFLIIIQGQWGQPTTLGFSTLIGGLMIASLRGLENSVGNTRPKDISR